MSLLILLMACQPAQPDAQNIRDACGTFDRDYARSVQAAERGDLAAIECEIAIADRIFRGADNTQPNAITSLTYRYLQWIVTDEQPADIFELAELVDQQTLAANLSLIFTHHLEATNQLYSDRYDENGCFLRPPRMDQLYRATRPHLDMATCETAVRDHPFG